MRWHLHEIDPDLDPPARCLIRTKHLQALARELADRDGTVARWARRLLEQCCQLTVEIRSFEAEISALVTDAAPSLQAILGCGILNAAKILAETADIHRFRSKSAYARHNRLRRYPCGRVTAHVIDFVVSAIANSTRLYTVSPSRRCTITQTPAPASGADGMPGTSTPKPYALSDAVCRTWLPGPPPRRPDQHRASLPRTGCLIDIGAIGHCPASPQPTHDRSPRPTRRGLVRAQAVRGLGASLPCLSVCGHGSWRHVRRCRTCRACGIGVGRPCRQWTGSRRCGCCRPPPASRRWAVRRPRCPGPGRPVGHTRGPDRSDQAFQPPSTRMSPPVMYEASGLATKAMTAATSSGVE